MDRRRRDGRDGQRDREKKERHTAVLYLLSHALAITNATGSVRAGSESEVTVPLNA
jgi:hypothetical protein